MKGVSNNNLTQLFLLFLQIISNYKAQAEQKSYIIQSIVIKPSF